MQASSDDTMPHAPAERLRAALIDLREHAGNPSSREIARGIGTASHTTIAEALSGKRVPSWAVVRAIVDYLGGDEQVFRDLWTSAMDAGTPPKRLDKAGQEFLARYRQHVALRHGRLEPPDFDRRRRVPITDIYVEQAIVAPEAGKAGSMKSVIGLREFDDRIARTVLLGDPGGGKTTACAVLMHRYAEDQDRSVPFLVTVRDFAGTVTPEQSVIAFIERELETVYQCPAPAGLLDRLLRDGRALVIFDGLDELLEPALRAEVASVIELFCMDFPASSVLVTSRLVGYGEAQLDPAQFTVYRLAGFRQEQAAEYIRKWFTLEEYGTAAEAEEQARALLEESSTAPDLRTNPLMLALLCILYRGEGSLPRDRADIYERCATLLFRKWDARRRIHASLRAGHLTEPVIRYVAWWMFTRDPAHPAATERDLKAEITRFLAGRGYERESDAADAAADFIQFARGRMWVLSDVGTTPNGEPLYAFTHRTFLEYFTAAHLAVTSDTPEQLAADIAPLVGRQEWEEVAELAVDIKDRTSDRGADRAFSAMLSKAPPSPEYPGILRFWLRTAIFADISPVIVRALTGRVFDYVNDAPVPADGPGMLASLLLNNGMQAVIADELAARIDRLFSSGSEAEQLAAARMVRAICEVQHGIFAQATGEEGTGENFWETWCEEILNRYPVVGSADEAATAPIGQSALSGEIARSIDTEAGTAMLLSLPETDAAQILGGYPPRVAAELLQAATGSRPRAAAAILRLLSDASSSQITDYLSPQAAASLLSAIPASEAVRILDQADIRTAAGIIMELPVQVSAQLASSMTDRRAGDILMLLTPAAATTLLKSMPEDKVAVLRRLNPSIRPLARGIR